MSPRLPSAQRGFTLAEIMVGMLLAGIVVAALYNMFITSSYVFNLQDQASATQLNLRYAMSQVREDLRRAGLHSTPNSAIDRFHCVDPAGEGGGRATAIQGIVHYDGESVDAAPYDHDANGTVTPDRVLLSGNYSSSATYPATLAGGLITVNLPEWTRRDDWRPSIYDGDSFATVFRDDQYVRITNSYGYGHIREIAEVNADAGQRVLRLGGAGGFVSTGLCGIGIGDAVEINPINFVEYRIEPHEPGNVNDTDTDLVRNFLDRDLERIDGTGLVVGQQIVDFQVWFLLKNGDTVGLPANIPDDADLLDDVGNVTPFVVDGTDDARPDLVRSAVVRICARAEREDPNWVHHVRDPLAAREALQAFDLDGDALNGTARVACLTGEVEVVNLTLRDLRPAG